MKYKVKVYVKVPSEYGLIWDYKLIGEYYYRSKTVARHIRDKINCRSVLEESGYSAVLEEVE